LRTLGEVDQESVYALATMSRLLCDMIAELRPHAIVTHPYEGGHPDHDAAAFAVSAAAKATALGKPVVQWKPLVIEFASYHNGNPSGPASLKSGEFLPDSIPVETVLLGAESRARKQRMFECFPSQREMLAHFQIDTERFRYAPAYDFTRAPHEGQLFYEAQNWGVGEEWRRLAAEAQRNQKKAS
jgi:LmbE family N-acetylglucosaminyl deacetylase